MLYLFSNQAHGALHAGATFMQTKQASLHPGMNNFYLINQAQPLHQCMAGLGPDSTFTEVNCRLSPSEAAIIIGHGGNDNNLYDENNKVVTAAALRLLAKIATDNPAGHYSVFLAACGGGVRQPGLATSLLSTLIRASPQLAAQLQQRSISCWSYTASAGLVHLTCGVPADRVGWHIYGTLDDQRMTEQHCGYDSRITTQLHLLPDGRYVTIFFAPALYPLADVINWAQGGCQPVMQIRFPNLFTTLCRTQ